MHVYDWLNEVAGATEAWRTTICLPTHTLLYDSLPILQNGVLITSSISDAAGSAIQLDGLVQPIPDPYNEIERLYAQFKRSVPSKGERLNRGPFKACASDQLSYEELNQNMPRQEARLLLEGFILLAASAGVLKWKNPNHFFWQGTDPDLILYRNWIHMEEEQHEKKQ